ncbi:MAG: hypothetical protein ACRCZZ_04190 [Phocaeicola sp.]
MIKVRHFKGGVYTVYAVDEEYVYYGDIENGKKWKREFFEFLSKDARSETGNRLDFVDFVEGSCPAFEKEDFIDVSNRDEDALKINVELFRKVATFVRAV